MYLQYYSCHECGHEFTYKSIKRDSRGLCIRCIKLRHKRVMVTPYKNIELKKQSLDVPIDSPKIKLYKEGTVILVSFTMANGTYINEKCTILTNDNNSPMVAVKFFEKRKEFHSCHERCELGYGRYISRKDIIKIVYEPKSEINSIW